MNFSAFSIRALAEDRVARMGLKLTPNLVLLAIAVFFWFASMSVQQSVANNFFVETLHMDAANRGFLEGFRELPGLFLVLISALVFWVRLPVLAMVSLLMITVQYLGFSVSNQAWQVIALTTFGSIGFHLWTPIYRELTFASGTRSQSGRLLGLVAGVGAAGTLIGMGSVYAFAPTLGYRMMFLWSAASAVVAAVAVSRVKVQDVRERPRRQRIVVRRRYSYYYLLTFLDGSARQIWGAFAVYMLVTNFGVDVRTVTAVLVGNSLIGVFLSPRIGVWIDRWGERKTMMIGYGGLIGVFGTLAFTNNIWLAIVVFFLYRLFFSFNISIQSYLRKIATNEDLAPTLAMGVSTEHMSGFAIPIVGGMLWMAYGYQFAFVAGALIALCCFLVVTRLPRGQLSARTVLVPAAE